MFPGQLKRVDTNLQTYVYRWEDCAKMEFKETGLEGVGFTWFRIWKNCGLLFARE
jgi:hypothetical protein